MVLDRHDLGIHLLVYPTLTVVRDDDHEIGSEFGARTTTSDDGGEDRRWSKRGC